MEEWVSFYFSLGRKKGFIVRQYPKIPLRSRIDGKSWSPRSPRICVRHCLRRTLIVSQSSCHPLVRRTDLYCLIPGKRNLDNDTNVRLNLPTRRKSRYSVSWFCQHQQVESDSSFTSFEFDLNLTAETFHPSWMIKSCIVYLSSPDLGTVLECSE